MLVATLVKNLLWALRYPVLPSQSELLGDFRVGAIQTRLPGSTACQIHYPTLDTETASQRPYFRPEAVAGLADYSKQPVELLQFLSRRSHPCLIDAQPVPGQKFPIVIFSHGLGGCMEMYTQLCQQVASYGYWVVALEHEDGSGAYAESISTTHDNDKNTERGATPVYYKRPDDTPYSRTKVTNFRRPFLEQRVQDVSKALDHVFHEIDDNQDNNNNISNDKEDITTQVFQAADRSQGVHLLGHSFGGATMVLAVQDETFAKRHPVKSLSLMDCWAFSLDDNALKKGCNSDSSKGVGGKGDFTHSTLHLLSEAWLTNPEVAEVNELLQNSSPPNNQIGKKVASYYVPNSVHASFSDAVCWFPGFVARKLWMRGPEEKRHETIRAAAQACVQHMRQEEISAAGVGEPAESTLKEYSYA